MQSIYLNTAGTGLLSAEAIHAAKGFLEQAALNSTTAFHIWMEHNLPELRKDAATLFDANENEVAFLPNFSFALSSVLQGLSGKLKKVLLYDADYPSLNMPFEVGNFDIYKVKDTDGFHIPTKFIIEKIQQEKIEIVALSHVQFLTGFKVDIETIGNFCKENGVIFIVDGTQTMGTTPVSFKQLSADVLIGSSYKWLNGGPGSATLLIKKDFIEKYPPAIAGFGSLDKSDGKDWKYTPSNLSFEPGHLNPTGLLQLHEGIKQKLRMGLEEISQHNSKLIKQLHDGLLKTSFDIIGKEDLENRLHILIFKASQQVADRLQDAGFSITWRKNTIRVSPHYYNTEEEIDSFLSEVDKKS